MNTLTKLALGLMGQLQPRPAAGSTATRISLPAPRRSGGLPLMAALRKRESQREFAPQALRKQTLSDLLWAAAGINRPSLGGRTAPSAMNAQEVLLYVALPRGLFRYEPGAHELQLAAATDVRRVTGYQDFVDTAPLDLVYVADHARMRLVPAAIARGLCLRCRRRDGTERVPLLRLGRPGHGDPRLVRPPRARAGHGPGDRPPVAAGADRRPAQGPGVRLTGAPPRRVLSGAAQRMSVILFGAFDRHNLGDLLFPHIVASLLPGRGPRPRRAGPA